MGKTALKSEIRGRVAMEKRGDRELLVQDTGKRGEPGKREKKTPRKKGKKTGVGKVQRWGGWGRNAIRGGEGNVYPRVGRGRVTCWRSNIGVVGGGERNLKRGGYHGLRNMKGVLGEEL